MSSVPAEAVADARLTAARADSLADPLAESPAESLARARARIQSIDALRGFVIILMALDHVRSYFSNAQFDPLDLAQTDLAMYMTRWMTHLCAPTFIFLAGVSAHLMSQRMETADLRRFLITRGLWLVALEFTVVQFAWSFNLNYGYGLFLQVIWAIGASMVILGLIVSWPRWLLASIALAMIVGHNLLDGIPPEIFGSSGWVWKLLHVKSQTEYAFVLYPLVPWVGVMMLGFCVGKLFDADVEYRRRALIALGTASLLAFVALRAINGYGDPNPWTAQSTPLFTLLSFINVHKYPPSLAYVLVTLGIGMLLLALFESMRGRLFEIMRTFGKVPLFVYVLHIVVAHLTAGLLALALGHGDAVLRNIFILKPEGWGFGLLGVYVAWLAVLAILYPACRWFAEVKRTRKEWWLSYL